MQAANNAPIYAACIYPELAEIMRTMGWALPQPYQRRAIRELEKREPTAGDLERLAKAEEKRARKIAKRARPKMNFVFLSGEVNPMNLDASERRFMVVMDDVEPSNAALTGAASCAGRASNDGFDHRG